MSTKKNTDPLADILLTEDGDYIKATPRTPAEKGLRQTEDGDYIKATPRTLSKKRLKPRSFKAYGNKHYTNAKGYPRKAQSYGNT